MPVPAPDRVNIPTTGSDAVATGSATLTLQRILQSISLKYGAGVPVTTKIVITYRVSDVDFVLLDITGNTDGTFFVSIELVDSAGAGRGVYLAPYLEGEIIMDVTLSDEELDAIQVTLVAL